MVVVLFTIKKKPNLDTPEYRACMDRMHKLIENLPGFIDAVEFHGEDGSEINLAHFESLETLDAWHNNPEHQKVQQEARESYYEWYHVEVLTTVREYSFKQGEERVVIYPKP